MKCFSVFCAVMGFLLTATPDIVNAGWMRIYGTPAYEEGRCVAQTSDGGYIVTGKTGEALWLLKLNAWGDTLWTRTFDKASSNSVIVTTDGGYLISGVQNSEWTGQSLYLVKTDAQGNTVWSQSYGKVVSTGQYASSTQDGGYIITGSSSESKLWVLKTNTTGDTLWTREFGVKGSGLWIAPSGDGDYIVTGYIQLADSIKDDLCILKLGSDGDTQWIKTYGLPGDYERGSDAFATPDGGYIITGKKGSNLWLVKTDSKGDTLWSKEWSNANGYGVEDAGDGGFVITGMSYGGLSKYDLLVLKTDAQGNQVRKRTYGGSNDDWGYSIKKCSQGGYIISGLTHSYGAGDYDLWLLKLNASGDTSGVREVPPDAQDLHVLSPIGSQIVLRFENSPGGFHAEIFDASGRKVDEIHSVLKSGVITWGKEHNPGVYFIVPNVTARSPEKIILVR